MRWALSAAAVVACVVAAVTAPAAAAAARPGWSVVPAPGPAGGTGGYLDGVGCSGAGACTAVGNFDNSAGRFGPFADRWNGTAFTVQPVPGPPGATQSGLSGVSCPAATACTAVGFYRVSPGGYPTTHGLAERWNGTAWSILPVPTPAGGGQLFGVSCTAAACAAIGARYAHAGVLAERWNGTTWSIQTTPTPPGVAASLDAVSCPAATDCTAAGYSITSAFQDQTLAEHWDGTTWSIQPTPDPPGGSNGLIAVACPATTSCLAVGDQSHGPLAERFGLP